MAKQWQQIENLNYKAFLKKKQEEERLKQAEARKKKMMMYGAFLLVLLLVATIGVVIIILSVKSSKFQEAIKAAKTYTIASDESSGFTGIPRFRRENSIYEEDVNFANMSVVSEPLTFITGEDSTFKILLPKDTSIKVEPNSEVHVSIPVLKENSAEVSYQEIELLKGSLLVSMTTYRISGTDDLIIKFKDLKITSVGSLFKLILSDETGEIVVKSGLVEVNHPSLPDKLPISGFLKLPFKFTSDGHVTVGTHENATITSYTWE